MFIFVQLAIGLWFSIFAAAAGMEGSVYGPKAGVPELTARNFKDQVLYNGNVTAVLFYAPWCGYCNQLEPEWKKTAKQLRGIARVVAVNCDADVNKPLCAKYGVQGFPTIKVFQPAKLTDLDFKSYAAEGKPLPKRRPKMYSYQGPREAKALTEFVINHLRNYVATLDSDMALKWMAVNKIPRVLMLPGKKYKSRLISPLLKVLSREYFGKMRFAAIPRRVDGAWNLLGMEAQEDSQLIYMSDDKSPVVYKGSMKKKAVKNFLDEQYALEMHRRKRSGVTVDREQAANGLEFVVEDQQLEELEHVRQERELQDRVAKEAFEAQKEAFSRHGMEAPAGLFSAPESAEASSKSSREIPAEATAGAPSAEDASAEEAIEYEYEESDAVTETDVEELEETDDTDEAGLDSTVIDVKPDQVVNEGPEAVQQYLSAHKAEQERVANEAAKQQQQQRQQQQQQQQQQQPDAAVDEEPSHTLPAGKATPTKKKQAPGIRTFDEYVERCLRPGFNCATMITTTKQKEDDLVIFIRSLGDVSYAAKDKTAMDFILLDEADEHLKAFLDSLSIDSGPSMLYWDTRRQRAHWYNEGWMARAISKFIDAAWDRHITLDLEIPTKYRYWLTKYEVERLAEEEEKKNNKKKPVHDEL